MTPAAKRRVRGSLANDSVKTLSILRKGNLRTINNFTLSAEHQEDWRKTHQSPNTGSQLCSSLQTRRMFCSLHLQMFNSHLLSSKKLKSLNGTGMKTGKLHQKPQQADLKQLETSTIGKFIPVIYRSWY